MPSPTDTRLALATCEASSGCGDQQHEALHGTNQPEDQKAGHHRVSNYAGGAPILDLPTDHPRQSVRAHVGAVESIELDAALYDRLKSASSQNNDALFITLLSSFATLLHRLTGQDDFVIAVPVAGQQEFRKEELVGHHPTYLPLRLHPIAGRSFKEFSDGVRDELLEARTNQSLTCDRLLNNPPSDGLPVATVMFNLCNSSFSPTSPGGESRRVEASPSLSVDFELAFILEQSAECLTVGCAYNTNLYDYTTIRRWLEMFQKLVNSASVNGDTALESLPILPPDVRMLMLDNWNATSRDYPKQASIDDLVSQVAEHFPNKVAVICSELSLTYAELEAKAVSLAGRLQSVGVKRGGLVGVCLDRSTSMVVGLLAVLKCGAAYVPMDPLFPAERLLFMVEDTVMPVILTQTSLRESLPPNAAALVMIDDDAVSSTFVPVSHDPEDISYLIFTSGSSGRPKGVLVPQRAVMNLLNSMRREPGLTSEDILLSVTTLSFDISCLEIFLPLTTGATVVVATRDTVIDGNLLINEIERHAITMLQATPATWRMLLEAGWKGSPALKILIGGEAVSRDLVNRLAPLCGELWNMYGPTETTIWSTIAELQAGEGPVSIGHPIDNTRVYVVNAACEAQPIGIVGELLIGGDGVTHGYHQRPDLTAERFVPTPDSLRSAFDVPRLYRTGDLARWTTDGTLEYLGRIDNQVKVRGYRIELEEIECLLEQHVSVEQAVTAVRNDRLIAYIRPVGANICDANDDLTQTLRSYLTTKLPDYMVPVAFVTIDAIPMTPNGKVDRMALPAPDEAVAPATARTLVVPRTVTEQMLLEIWQQILGMTRICVHDDIFELGGDSILIFQITTRATRAGLALTPADVFKLRTIAALAALRSRPDNQPAAPSIQSANRDAYRRKL